LQQPSLFETPPPTRAAKLQRERVTRDRVVAAVGDANDRWAALAETALALVIQRLETFIVDDVWDMMPSDAPTPTDNRAMGAVLTRAIKAGLIRKTPNFRPSARQGCHANPRRVWQRT
jgi:hypothetical protein